MSDNSESESSGLSDWALVTAQGDLVESHEVKCYSLEVKSAGVHATTQECIELDVLMRQADSAAVAAHSISDEDKCITSSRDTILSVSSDSNKMPLELAADIHSQHLELMPETVVCSEMLQGGEERRPVAEAMEEKFLPLSKDFDGLDSCSSCASLLSISEMSSLLSTTSKSNSSDSDNESDFIRLEKDPLNTSSESEAEEYLQRLGPSALTSSGSSVSSGFNFFTSAAAAPDAPVPSPVPFLLQPHRVDEGAIHKLVHSSLQLPQELDGMNMPVVQSPPQQHEERCPPNVELPVAALDGELPFAAVDGELPVAEAAVGGELPVAEAVVDGELPVAAVAVNGNLPGLQPHGPQVAAYEADMEIEYEEADTESSAEDQDDRIESEQSDDAHSAQADDIDLSIVNDIGDIPVVRGDVERHYIHCNNSNLNWRLNMVVLAVLILALGMGLGHWIGCTREHLSQMEIQLAQLKRMHQIQDDYVQCLSRNDELLFNQDIEMQGERERYSEVMADLRDNNHQLQKQLQAAQDQIEDLWASIKVKAQAAKAETRSSKAVKVSSQDLPGTAVFLQDFFSLVMVVSQKNSERQRQDTENKVATLRQLSNDIQKENEVLRMTISKLRYNPDTLTNQELRLGQWMPVNESKGEAIECFEGSCDSRQQLLSSASWHLRELLAVIADWDPEDTDMIKDYGWSEQQLALLGRSHVLLEEWLDKGVMLSAACPKKREAIISEMKQVSEKYNQYRTENRELRESLIHMRSKGTYVDIGETVFSIPPPPNPVPPPPLVEKFPSQEQELEDDMLDDDLDVIVEVEEDETIVNEANKVANEARNNEEADLHSESLISNPTGTSQSDLLVTEIHFSSAVPQHVPMDALTLLQRNLTRERKRSEMWRYLYVEECKKQRQHWVNTTICLSYLMKEINLTTFLQYVSSWNLTSHDSGQFANLSSLLVSVITLQQDLVQALPSLWHELSSTILGSANDADPKHGESLPDKTVPPNEALAGDGTSGEEIEAKTRWSASVKNLLNKTQSTIFNVSQQIQKTWSQVKNTSRQLWQKDSLLGHMASRLTESISRISHKVHKKATQWLQKQENKIKDKTTRWLQKENIKMDKRKHKNQEKQMKKPERWQFLKSSSQEGQSLHLQYGTKKNKKDHILHKVEEKTRHRYSEPKYDKQKQHDEKERTGFLQEGKRKSKLEYNRKSDCANCAKTQWASKGGTKLDQVLHKLFMKICLMSKHSYKQIGRKKVQDVYKRLQKVSKRYSAGSHQNRPNSSNYWLNCQLAFWKDTYLQRCSSWHTQECLQYLAPWQQYLAQLGYPGDEKSNACGNQHEEIKRANSQEISSSSDNIHTVSGKAGKRENKSNTTWYTHWVEGRNTLRSGEHKADWLFERADDRDVTRHEKDAARWLFERAAARDADRESFAPLDAQKKHQQDWNEKRKMKEFNQHWHQPDVDENKDFRQKYGKKYNH